MFDFFKKKEPEVEEKPSVISRIVPFNKNKSTQSKEKRSSITQRPLNLLPTHHSDTTSSSVTSVNIPIPSNELKFYQGGVRQKKYKSIIKWVGRIGFIAKGIVYGCIGVLTITNVTGAWTPNGSEGNESPQGAFLLLGGIPSIGRSILIVMAVGLVLYIIWRFWEAITGQGSDATFGKKKNFFRYRLSPAISGMVYSAYCYYIIHMIFQTSEEQQHSASSSTFPASWTSTGIGKAGIALLGIAFLIACVTQIINALSGSFIRDLKTSEPNYRSKWEARVVHLFGRIGFSGRAALFGTLSGFFWDSLAKQNESGTKNMVAAAISKLANSGGGKFFMVLLGLTLIVYSLFAVSNAYYKYFPTPPPSREEFYTQEEIHPESDGADIPDEINNTEKNTEKKANGKQGGLHGMLSSLFSRKTEPEEPAQKKGMLSSLRRKKEPVPPETNHGFFSFLHRKRPQDK